MESLNLDICIVCTVENCMIYCIFWFTVFLSTLNIFWWMGWLNLIDKINNGSSSVAPLSCCSCVIFFGHRLYHKLPLSSTCSVFPARFAGIDLHIIHHILFHIEMFYTQFLGRTFFHRWTLGAINYIVQLLMKNKHRWLLSLTAGCARGCSGVLLTIFPAHIIGSKCYSEARKLPLSVFRTAALQQIYGQKV